MKVYVCYECYDNGCDVFRRVDKVVDTLVKATEWHDAGGTFAVDRWRVYESIEVE